ncbi:hypothetical protein [Halosimplex sp. TS25]|uniref:hypothetical protein n=1 Tax=Halosimplex rarum TaxID=3396619 RepID=UPI0039EC58AF
MRRIWKIAITLTLFCVSLTVAIGRIPSEDLPTPTIYIILLGLVGIGTLTTLYGPPMEVGFPILILTAALPVFLVIGPGKPGLYGYDPYYILSAAQEFKSGIGIDTLIYEYNTRPLLYGLITVLSSISDIKIGTVGKYLPLMTVFMLVFLILLFRTRERVIVALLAGFAIAMSRPMLLFQSKLVLQIISVPLLFLVLFLSLRYPSSKRLTATGLLVAFSLAIAHKVTAAIALVLLCCLAFSLQATKTPLRRIVGERDLNDTRVSDLIQLALLIGIIFICTFIYADENAFIGYSLSLFTSDQVGSSATALPGYTLIQTVAIYGQLALLAVLSIMNAVVVLPNYNSRWWEVGLVGFNGLLMVTFLYQSTTGSLTGLHANRLLLFSVPLLFVIALSVIYRVERLNSLSSVRSGVIVALILSFSAVQLMGVAPHALYGDMDDPIAESHFSTELRSGADWGADYADEIIGFERDVWRDYAGATFTDISWTNNCRQGALFVVRDGVSAYETDKKNNIYQSTNLTLYQC